MVPIAEFLICCREGGFFVETHCGGVAWGEGGAHV